MMELLPSVSSGLYVYHPDLMTDGQLCARCQHARSDHNLAPLSGPADRSRLKEFSAESLEQYQIPMAGRRSHPVDVAQHALRDYYNRHPAAPGASDRAASISMAELELEATTGSPAAAGGDDGQEEEDAEADDVEGGGADGSDRSRIKRSMAFLAADPSEDPFGGSGFGL